eukprot:gene5993-4298_t
MSSNDQVVFNTNVDAEVQEMERHVEMLQEELKLKNLQEAAAEDEGTRKKAAAPGTAAKEVKSIFVGGMDPRTSEADLRLFFSSCGTIARVTILRDKASGQPKGNAYIEFETQEQAQAALLKEGQSLHGKPLKVAIKRDNVPGFHRGAGFYAPRGRGVNPMQQQLGAAMGAAMLSMMTGGMGFSPFSPAAMPFGEIIELFRAILLNTRERMVVGVVSLSQHQYQQQKRKKKDKKKELTPLPKKNKQQQQQKNPLPQPAPNSFAHRVQPDVVNGEKTSPKNYFSLNPPLCVNGVVRL